MNDGRAFVFLGAVAFLLGLRGSIRLLRRYQAVSPKLVHRERLLLGAIVTVAWLITAAAGYFDAASALRLFGVSLPIGTPIVSIVIASVILFIPVGLDWVVNRVARVPWTS